MPNNPCVHTDSNSKGCVPGIRECSSICTGGEARSAILSFFLSLCLCLFWPVLPNTFSPGAICLISCTFLWSCLLTLADEYLLHNNTYSMYYYEQILRYSNCGLWIKFSHSIHIHHDNEMLGIALVVHTPTLAETEYTVWAILQYVWILHIRYVYTSSNNTT